jgi:hypothetical protein
MTPPPRLPCRADHAPVSRHAPARHGPCTCRHMHVSLRLWRRHMLATDAPPPFPARHLCGHMLATDGARRAGVWGQEGQSVVRASLPRVVALAVLCAAVSMPAVLSCVYI